MTFFYILHVIICILLVATILFQDGKTGGLVSVQDSSQAVFGAKGASSFLTKLTSVLAILFMCLSLFLAFRSSPSNKSIASDYAPPAAEQGTGTGVEPTGDGATPATGVEVLDSETGEEKEGIQGVDVVTDPNQLPSELKKGLDAEQQREEAKKKEGESQDNKEDNKE